jgi:hypothetical protein
LRELKASEGLRLQKLKASLKASQSLMLKRAKGFRRLKRA